MSNLPPVLQNRSLPVIGAPLFIISTPKLVIDRHIPLLTFVALAWVWLFALIEKASLCRIEPAQGLCQ